MALLVVLTACLDEVCVFLFRPPECINPAWAFLRICRYFHLCFPFLIGLCMGWLCFHHQPYSTACVCSVADAEIQQEGLHR